MFKADVINNVTGCVLQFSDKERYEEFVFSLKHIVDTRTGFEFVIREDTTESEE